jgi:hypothetical protein
VLFKKAPFSKISFIIKKRMLIMNLDNIWAAYMELLKGTKEISAIHKKTYSGIPFIYLQPSSSITEIEIEELLKQAAIKVIIHMYIASALKSHKRSFFVVAIGVQIVSALKIISNS